jgi:hypothetical protein
MSLVTTIAAMIDNNFCTLVDLMKRIVAVFNSCFSLGGSAAKRQRHAVVNYANPARRGGVGASPTASAVSRPASGRFRGEADMNQQARLAGLVEVTPLPQSAIQSSCIAVFLFDQLVRAQQDRCRHIEAKRLGGRHIEHGLVFHRQLHRQIGRLLALKDAVDVGGGAASMAYLVRPI